MEPTFLKIQTGTTRREHLEMPASDEYILESRFNL